MDRKILGRGELLKSLFKGAAVGGTIGCLATSNPYSAAVSATVGAAIAIVDAYVERRNLNKRHVELQSREPTPPLPDERPADVQPPALPLPVPPPGLADPADEEPAGPADDLPPLINREPGLPELLFELEEGRYTGPTGIPIDMGNLGQFQIHHVPDDGNCLFAAIGHFVKADLVDASLVAGGADQKTLQRAVRRQIYDYAQSMSSKESSHMDFPGDAIDLRRIIRVANPTMEHGAFGGYQEARIAAMAFRKRVFIVNHFHGGGIPAYEGYNFNGERIDMGHLDRPINPGQGPLDDIVLYFIMNPDP
ncbi:MAG: hypothetical protein LBS22_01075, partial [Puniceicoccales bacterium]|nr:hypothetical protein [Puniceicoccales bacterium]